MRQEDCIPNRRRTGVFDAQPAQIELPLSNASYQLDARNGDRSVAEYLEAEHRADPRFHAAMILLDHIVQVLRRA